VLREHSAERHTKSILNQTTSLKSRNANSIIHRDFIELINGFIKSLFYAFTVGASY